MKKMLSSYEENKAPTNTPSNPTPRIEPGKIIPAHKLPPIRRTDTVDQIPGTAPGYNGPWQRVRGGHTRDTITDYIKRQN